uniref:Tryptophan-rich sensory protein n=1 Tax=Candidatus Caldatribacterium californiense TaxID=1454726 RepID=A0A7V3YI17_9BACT
MMGIALYLVWQANFGGARAILSLYFLRLAANIPWSLFFLGMRNLLFPWRPCSTPPFCG